MTGAGWLTREELEAAGFASVGENVLVDRSARIYGASRLSIGDDSRIDAFAVVSCGEGGVAIGRNVHIASFVFMAGAARIELADFSGLSGRVSVYSSSDDYSGAALTNPTVPEELANVLSAPVSLGRHVIVGAGSVILPGVTLGEGSAVGALSLVREDVPEFTIVAGVPAKVRAERQRRLLDLERDLLARS
jgi:galactoside O-acetyltransferase